MSITSAVQEQHRLTVFTVEGEMSLQEQIAVLRNFYTQGPTENVIWDLRKVEGERLSPEDLKLITAFVKRYVGNRPRGKTAIVSTQDVDFGISRVVEVYNEIANLPWETRGFRSYTQALQWIESG